MLPFGGWTRLREMPGANDICGTQLFWDEALGRVGILHSNNCNWLASELVGLHVSLEKLVLLLVKDFLVPIMVSHHHLVLRTCDSTCPFLLRLYIATGALVILTMDRNV